MPPKRSDKPCGQYILAYKGSNTIVDAMKAIRTGNMSVRKAAAHFNKPRSTLADRASGRILDEATPGRKPVIPVVVESKLVGHATELAEKGFGISRRQLLVKTVELCKSAKIYTPFKNGVPGKAWWNGLERRHSEIAIRRPEKLGTVKARMLNREVVNTYVSTLKTTMDKLQLHDKPNLVWNCDESGKQLEHTPVKVTAGKGSKSVVMKTANSRSTISILASVNAAGQSIPPMLEVKGKPQNSIYGYNVAAAPPETVFTYQKNAWMAGELVLDWFKQVFLKYCGGERQQLLILDGHSSHQTCELLK